MAKLGWQGGGLGLNEQGIDQPISAGEIVEWVFSPRFLFCRSNCLGSSWGVYYRNELRSFAATVVDLNPSSSHINGQLVVPSIGTGFFNESYAPLTKWNYNWDNRDPLSMINDKKYNAADDEEKKTMLEKVKPTATRNIFLIRHGQYFLDSEKKNLTELGREQALLLGKRLAAAGINANYA
uniref:G-patch domain-containing protein n=1 Tax=Ditylenchus dipsaci TaxID=166011 RepID=A0A915DLC1_9BILA